MSLVSGVRLLSIDIPIVFAHTFTTKKAQYFDQSPAQSPAIVVTLSRKAQAPIVTATDPRLCSQKFSHNKQQVATSDDE